MEAGPEALIVLLIVEVPIYVEDIIVSELGPEHSKFILISQLIIHLDYHIKYTQSILLMMNGFDYLKMVSKYIRNNLIMILVQIFVEMIRKIELPHNRQYLVIPVLLLQ